jgi:hypothetical protein
MKIREEAWAGSTRALWVENIWPNYQPHEVEIARIELQSTTSDVISLRAKGSQRRIKYRLVDQNDVAHPDAQRRLLVGGLPSQRLAKMLQP